MSYLQWHVPAVVLAGAILSAAAPQRTASKPESLDRLQALTSYDVNRPFDVKETDVREQNGVRTREMTYARLNGGRLGATLVEAAGPGLNAAVLFAHWYSPESPDSNRTQFLPEAERLARQGVVSLLIDTMWTDPKWFEARNPTDDYETSIEQIRELRRALDLLLAGPRIDRTRVVFVGHDFGAMYGVTAAAVDGRIKAFAFLAGTARFSDWFLFGRKLQGPERQRVIDELAPIDPIAHIGELAPAPILFQFATTDEYVSEAAATALVRAAKEPKEVRWYKAGHGLDAEARRDLYEWLTARVGVSRGAP
jgi:dienelactone hydrolase